MRISPHLRAAATLLVGFTAVSFALLTLGTTTAAHATGPAADTTTTAATVPCADKDGDPDDFCPVPTTSTTSTTTASTSTTSTSLVSNTPGPPIITGCIGAGCNSAVTTVAPEVTPTTLASGSAVLAAQGAPTPSAALASTGMPVGRLLVVAAGLVLCGIGLLGLARRRDRDPKLR